MSVRTDITVDFNASPRIIEVALPSTDLTIQDLHDTLTTIEEDLDFGLQFNRLIRSAGKEDLGGGVSVGITSTLLDAKLAFEARPGPSFVQCRVSGGNLVAVDTAELTIDPIQTTAFTQVVRTSSSSATILDREDINIKFLLEAKDGRFGAFGDIYYFDPINGDDSNDGRTPSTGVKTFAAAHALVTTNNHDVIFFLPTDASGTTTLDDILIVTKNQVSLRGPGIDFRIIPTGTQTASTIKVDGNGCSIIGLELRSAVLGGQDVVEVNGENFRAKSVFIRRSANNGFTFNNTNHNMAFVDDCHVMNCVETGVEVNGSGSPGGPVVEVRHSQFHDNKNGVRILGTFDNQGYVENCQFSDHTEFGIRIAAGVTG